jgi:hypothetical protein
MPDLRLQRIEPWTDGVVGIILRRDEYYGTLLAFTSVRPYAAHGYVGSDVTRQETLADTWHSDQYRNTTGRDSVLPEPVDCPWFNVGHAD